MARFQRISPLLLLLIAVVVTLFILIVRGLNIPPLQTDIFILRGWFEQFGPAEFADYYFHINQRHPLVGPIYTFTYSIFGEQDFYYNLFFQAGRLLNGALLGGIVMQFTGRKALALCVGLALMFTPVRLPESYQQLCWLIELSLTLLLLSLYGFIRSNQLRQQAPEQNTQRLVWYSASFLLYVISILIYEAGLPWLAVFAFVGWVLRSDQPLKQRVLYLFRDLLPFLICALAILFAIFFVWTVWDMIAPTQGTGGNALRQFVTLFGSLVQFPQLYLQRLTTIGGDGYYRWTIIAAVGAAVLIGGLVWLLRQQDKTKQPTSSPFFKNGRVWLTLLGLGLTMLVASILVGATASDPTPTYLDRTTFGRAAGITLIYVTLIFAIFDFMPARWKTVLAAAATGLILIGPGAVWLFAYQDYAHRTHGEIERMVQGIEAMRWQMTAPVHLVIITPENWVGARFTDAVDLINHEAQQLIWDRNLAATIDILQTGAPPEEYAVELGTCLYTGPEGPAGVCIDEQTVYHSRWAQPLGPTSPIEDLILLRYDEAQGTMTIVPEIRLDQLAGYNIHTAALEIIRSSAERLVMN